MSYLKDKFEAMGISKQELANRTGIDRATLSYYINGRKKVNKLDHVYKLTITLDLEFTRFVLECLDK